MESVWDYWRLANMALALVCILAHLIKAVWFKLHLPLDAVMGYMAVVGFAVGYFCASLFAWLAPGGEAGPWTAIMFAPLLWGAIAGCVIPRTAERRSRPKTSAAST